MNKEQTCPSCKTAKGYYYLYKYRNVIFRRVCFRCLSYRPQVLCINCFIRYTYGHTCGFKYSPYKDITKAGMKCEKCERNSEQSQKYDAYFARVDRHIDVSCCDVPVYLPYPHVQFDFYCGQCVISIMNSRTWEKKTIFCKVPYLTHSEKCQTCYEKIPLIPPSKGILSLRQMALEACGKLRDFSTLPERLQNEIIDDKRLFYPINQCLGKHKNIIL